MNDPLLHPVDVADAIETLLAQAWPPEAEKTPLAQAGGRVLAERIVADRDLPPFDRALVDGYAARLEDASAQLRLLETVHAGREPQHEVGPGACIKVMTGAPIPRGTECILMVEHVREADGALLYEGPPPRPNFAPRGREARAGELLLPPGTHLTPANVALCAAVGATSPLVWRRCRVAVFSTGDELVPVGTEPRAAQIRNSNSIQLRLLCEQAGCEVRDGGILPDALEALRDAIAEALLEADVVITSGGVSMGELDLLPRVYEMLGFAPHLRRVRMQPGKPIFFGTCNRQAVCGLAGNPVSSFVQFHVLVRPFLRAIQGGIESQPALSLPLVGTLSMKPGNRTLFLPVRFVAGGIAACAFKGSGDVSALRDAQALAEIPSDMPIPEEGSLLRIHLLPFS